MPYVPPTSNANDLIGLRVKLTRYQRYKKRCPNINQCYVLSQVDVKLIDKDLREWVTGIQQGIANIQNPPYKLAMRLTKKAVRGGNNRKFYKPSTKLANSYTVKPTNVIILTYIANTPSIQY